MNATRPISPLSSDALIERLAGARAQLRALIDALPAGGWLGPRAAHLNPPLWEYGHIVWFQERWCLRARPDGTFARSLLAGADALYDSSNVAHDTRWDLALLDPHSVAAYADTVAAGVAERLRSELDNATAYFAELSVYHELMHVEAWWMAFQNLGYAPPAAAPAPAYRLGQGKPLRFAAGEVELGSGDDAGFIFDNEKWRHVVAHAAFDIDAQPVSETAFAAFVDAGGYADAATWSDEGRIWRTTARATHPLYWRRADNAWQARSFDVWRPLDAGLPVLHVNRHEAEAYARWAGRRLPTAAEWARAAGEREFARGMGWEWLDETFAPYAGFAPDPYEDYSQPWFDTHVELRGGGPYTDAALKRPGYRNFYLPHRRDPFAGFRTAGPVQVSRRSST